MDKGRAAAPVLAIVVTAALPGAQLGLALHLALVTHQRCVEHGDSVHAPTSETGHDESATRGLSSRHRRAGQPGHDHCTHPSIFDGDRHSPAVHRGSEYGPHEVPPPITVIRGVARLYLTAPKSSPPRRA